MEMVTTIDVSRINYVIPEVVAFGRRTMREQSVTSAGIIAVNAQKGTKAATIESIYSSLDAIDHVAGNKYPKFVKSGQETYGTMAVGPLNWTVGMMIAVQRTMPNSRYSQDTGNRWPLAYPGGLKGYQRFDFFRNEAEKMKSARHSSTHFLQHGWAPAIKILLGSPEFKGWNSRYGGGITKAASRAAVTSTNSLSLDLLGTASIEGTADSIVVTGENSIGRGSNDVLDKKHRAALITYGLLPLQIAVDAETRSVYRKIQDYLDRGLVQKY